MFIDFREKGRARERERERDWERETSIGYLLCVPRPGIEPTNFLMYGMMFQSTEPPHQGSKRLLKNCSCLVLITLSTKVGHLFLQWAG